MYIRFMQSLCREQLCYKLEQIIASELDTPNLTKGGNGSNYEKARYLYVYICHIHLDAEFKLIRRTMPIYNYQKTVYQVFRRMWMRRKEQENAYMIAYLKRVFDEYKQTANVRTELKQMKMF